MIIDSKRITHYVYAHQRNNGQWYVHDTHLGLHSTTTYSTYDEANKAYFNGEIPMIKG